VRNLVRPAAGIILLLLTVSCKNGGSGQEGVKFPLPESGVLHEKVACKGQPGKSYALFIPGNTSLPDPLQSGKEEIHKRVYPVMIVFDPHGNGVFPLTLYKDLAEKYGFILFGSNDSKNGLPAEEIKSIIDALMNEVHIAYPVDTNRIYLLGFSGGARVAAMAAMYQVQVKGVIGCGAGLGGTEQPIRYKFDYFGIAGTADFNMSEMLQLEEPLSRAGFRHFIMTFPGVHAWPSTEVMEDAFRWITLNSMKDGLLKKEDRFISGVKTVLGDRINAATNNHMLITADDECRKAISFLEGLVSVDSIKSELQALEKLHEYQSQVAYRKKIMKMEEEEKQELMQALQAENLTWWKVKITNYELRITNDIGRDKKTDPEDTLKNRRLMAFLSLYCYMNANAAIARQNVNAAVKIIAIYEMADKGNPEPNYMRATLFARQSESEGAFAQLKIAIDKGFNDKHRLNSQQEFSSMKSAPEWSDLLKKIQ